MWRFFATLLSVFFTISPVSALPRKDTRVVLQFTDFHYDKDYSVQGTDRFCHLEPGKPANETLGKFGDYKCDPPIELIKHAIQSTQKLLRNRKPELILWTGDTIPHIEKYDEEYAIDAIATPTQLLQQYFPNTLVLPVFGNHDYAPSDQQPADVDSSIYARTFQLWKKWIGDEAKNTFLRGGYYRYVDQDGTIFLMLNTNLYYRFNYVNFSDPDDPAGQFRFMEENLEFAKRNKTAIHVIAHIAPGFYEWKIDFYWLKDYYNTKFMEIVKRYSTTIKWMVFGHHHTDTFHMVKNDKDEFVQVMLLSPSITPWYSNLSGGANNPSYRLFLHRDWALQDIETYYIDLNELNANSSTEWSLEYSMAGAYQLSEINAQEMGKVLERMKTDEGWYAKYLEYNTVKWKPVEPEVPSRDAPATKRAHLCSIEFVDYPKYRKCIEGNGSREINSIVWTVVLTLSILFYVLW